MRHTLFVYVTLLVLGCGPSAPGDGTIDGGGGGGDAPAGAPDAPLPDAFVPDARMTVGTCEACASNLDCDPGFLCVLSGGGRVCLKACTPENPDCPEDFACGGVETTFCAPTDGICCVDHDDDGYGTGIQCIDLDCDDDDATVNPGADDICNDVDDDCDPTTEDGSGDPLLGSDCDGMDTDLCKEGVFYCAAGGILECDDATDDILDLCDGVDNDCNPATLDGSDDAMVGSPCDSPSDADLCLDDQYVCDSAGGVVICQDNIDPKPDLCDGADNDCDPSTPDGSGDPLVGTPCDGPDSDLCNEGTWGCASGTLVCSDTTGDTLDLCNGMDDDCDPVSADGSEDPLIGVACDGADADLCPEGVTVCAGGMPLCNDVTGPNAEVCNNVDDDCNPATPDGAHEPWLGNPCDGPDGDQCLEGTLQCSGGVQICTDTTDTIVESCNDADDDCDGSVDETFNKSTDVNNCGSCGTVCTNPHGTTACSGGVCSPTCVGLWGDCDGDPQNGCETPTNTLSNCGACGAVCDVPNGSESCSTGTCQVTSCDAGYCNLDGMHSNGCEHDLDVDPSCGTAIGLGNVSGDASSAVVSVNGRGEQWYRIRVTENDGDLSCEDLCAVFDLSVPPGTNYDLEVYCDNCSGVDNSSSNGTGVNETTHVRWDENCFLGIPTGSDSSRDIYIRVRYVSANVCSQYTLTVTGDVCRSGNTCGSK